MTCVVTGESRARRVKVLLGATGDVGLDAAWCGGSGGGGGDRDRLCSGTSGAICGLSSAAVDELDDTDDSVDELLPMLRLLC